MTPGHLVTTDSSTAPQPPAEMCHHPRDQCDQETSGRVSRVTWREHCHHTVTGDQVPGVTTLQT